MPARPQLQLVGLHTDKLRLKTAAVSLDGLLDYNTSDKDECTFELSLFAEAFHEALMRDAGCTILAELYRQRDAAVKRREDRKRKRDAEKASESKKAKTEEVQAKEEASEALAATSAATSAADDKAAAAAAGGGGAKKVRVLSSPALARAFRFLDKTGAGYIKTEDLRRLLDALGLALHHVVAMELCVAVSDTGRYKNERVQYMRLCETEVDAPSEPEPAPAAPAAPAGVQPAEPAPAAAPTGEPAAATAAEAKQEEEAAQAQQAGEDVEMKGEPEGEAAPAAEPAPETAAAAPEADEEMRDAAVAADGGVVKEEQEEHGKHAQQEGEQAGQLDGEQAQQTLEQAQADEAKQVQEADDFIKVGDDEASGRIGTADHAQQAAGAAELE